MNINENTENGRQLIQLKYIHSYCRDQISRICRVLTEFFTLNTPWYFLDFAHTRALNYCQQT